MLSCDFSGSKIRAYIHLKKTNNNKSKAGKKYSSVGNRLQPIFLMMADGSLEVASPSLSQDILDSSLQAESEDKAFAAPPLVTWEPAMGSR